MRVVENEKAFYDGEGNTIPTDVVELLVQSQFVILDKQEQQVLEVYFPETILQNYADSLETIGYSKTWAYEKALVELGLRDTTPLYISIIED